MKQNYLKEGNGSIKRIRKLVEDEENCGANWNKVLCPTGVKIS